VFDRLLASGLSIESVEQHLTAGRVRVDGQVVTHPDTPAPPRTTITLGL
jgi:stalled ribosome rescue protein Dom34